MTTIPNVGDRVVIVNTDGMLEEFFSMGDTGTITEVNSVDVLISFDKDYAEYHALYKRFKVLPPFQVGDKVIINEHSKYGRLCKGQSCPITEIGHIGIIQDIDSCGDVHVKWDDGTNELYTKSDTLLPADILKYIQGVKVNNVAPVTCSHPNKYINRAMLTPFWVCPDCKADLGNA